MKKGKGLLYGVALALTLFTSCSKTDIAEDAAQSTGPTLEQVETLKANYGLTSDFFVAPIEKVILNNQTYQLNNLTKAEFTKLEKAFATHHEIFLDAVGSVFLSEQLPEKDFLDNVYKQYLGDRTVVLDEGVDPVTGISKRKKFQVARASIRLYPFCGYEAIGNILRRRNGRNVTQTMTLPTRTFVVTAKKAKGNYGRKANFLRTTVSLGGSNVHVISSFDSGRIFTWSGDQDVYLRFKGYSSDHLKGRKTIDDDKTYTFKVVNRKWDVYACHTVGSFDFGLTVLRNR